MLSLMRPSVAPGLTLICVNRINKMPDSRVKPLLAFIGHEWKLNIKMLGGFTNARKILINSVKYN